MLDSHDPSDQSPHAFEDSAALVVQAQPSGSATTGRNHDKLSALQRAFAREYVLCGGNATKAATLAGYEAGKSAAIRNLASPAVLAEIKRLAIVHVEALLPITLRRLFDVMMDPETPPKDVISACNSILDRGGMKPKTAPLVQINQQQNFSGADAQSLIREVWEARNTRIGGTLSDIPAAMSDMDDAHDDDAGEQLSTAQIAAADPSPPGGVGGVPSPGSHPSVLNLSPYSGEHSPPAPQSKAGWLWNMGPLGAAPASAPSGEPDAEAPIASPQRTSASDKLARATWGKDRKA